MKKLSLFIVLLVATLFVSCEKDLYETPIKQEKISSQKITVSQVMSEIRNPLIKNYLNTNYKQQLELTTAKDGIFELLFEKITKENEYVTYSLMLNSYSEETPYFLYFIITKDGADEKAGFAKYLPTDETTTLNMESFTGKIQISDLEGNIKIESDLINSISQEARNYYEYFCETAFYVIQHNCTQGGNHEPGDGTCADNNGYYEIIEVTTCQVDEDPLYLAPPSSFMGSPTTGGGSLTNEQFYNNLELSAQQNSWLANNDYFKIRLRTDYFYVSEVSEVIDIKEEYKEKLNFLMSHTSICNEARQYMTDNSNIMSYQDFVWDSFHQMFRNPTLHLDFKASSKSPMNVDRTAIDTTTTEGQKFDCIYQKLMQSSAFNDLFSNIFNNNSRANVKFGIKNASELLDNSGNPVLAQTIGELINGNLVINININREFLLSQSPYNYGSNVFIAKVIAHECIHAFLKYLKFSQGESIANINNQSIAQLIASYVNHAGITEHDFMANELVPYLANVLSEIMSTLLTPAEISNFSNEQLDFPGANINEPWSWNDFATQLSMQGLENTNYFNTNYYQHTDDNLEIIQMMNPQNTAKYYFYKGKAQIMSNNCQ